VVYPDIGFVLTALFRDDGPRYAQLARMQRELTYPIQLSALHRLQVENSLLRLAKDTDADRRLSAHKAYRLWAQYLSEEVFTIASFDLNGALVQAAKWNSGFKTQPDFWPTLLHPAIAVASGRSFLSLDVPVRQYAAALGVPLFPGKLEPLK
jgi:hypothetical protein